MRAVFKDYVTYYVQAVSFDYVTQCALFPTLLCASVPMTAYEWDAVSLQFAYGVCV